MSKLPPLRTKRMWSLLLTLKENLISVLFRRNKMDWTPSEINLRITATCSLGRFNVYEVRLHKRTTINYKVEGWEKENITVDFNVANTCAFAWMN
jgi:hypothetical protein